MNRYVIYVLVCLMASCQPENAKDAYQNISALSTKKDIRIHKLELDTIIPNTDSFYSGELFWQFREDSMYLFDRAQGTVDIFSLDGQFSRRALGVGRGPGEVQECIGTAGAYKDGWLILDGYFIYYFSKDFSRKQLKYLSEVGAMKDASESTYVVDEDQNTVDHIEFYVSTELTWPQVSECYDGTALISICCEVPSTTMKQFYMESKIAAKYDFEAGVATQLMGKYPPAYRAEQYTVEFPNHYFTEYKNNQYLLSFEIDSLIYICNDEMMPEVAMGRQGAIINTDYPLTQGEAADPSKYYIKPERRQQGFYMTVFYCAERDLILRTYKKGIPVGNNSEGVHNQSRMQIYKANKLIGDVTVPDHFVVQEYQAPYFYADGYFEVSEDGENDKIGVYKFKLEE